MATRNPYAPSAASLRLDPTAGQHAHAAGGVWRDGKVLVTATDAGMPLRCVKCNESCEAPKKPRTVYWHHWAIYLLLLLNVIIYAIVAVTARRKAKVAPGLCERHTARRRIAITVAWVGVLGSIAAMGASISYEAPVLMVAGILVLLVSMLFGMITGRIVWAKHIDKEYVRLKGCGPDFLDSLPHFPH